MTMRIGMRYIRRIISKASAIIPAAFSYDNIEGQIHFTVYGAYDDYPTQPYLAPPEPNTSPLGGGTYDNRL